MAEDEPAEEQRKRDGVEDAEWHFFEPSESNCPPALQEPSSLFMSLHATEFEENVLCVFVIPF